MGEWLEYTVNVAEEGDYTMYAAVASDGGSSFMLSIDGKAITDTVAVPKAVKAEGDTVQNFDEYNKAKANVKLAAGEHILRLTITADWMDIDYINFEAGENSDDSDPIKKEDTEPAAIAFGALPQRLNFADLEVRGQVQYFDMQGHRLNKAAAQKPGVYLVHIQGLGNRIVRVEK